LTIVPQSLGQLHVNGELDDAGDSSLYYLHDANFNVTGLVDRAETAVVERYMYEPYGRVTVLNGADDADESVNDWSVDSDPDTSDWSNELLYCGYRRDAESALYHVRNRYYHPTLGRWLSRDTIGYMGGIHLVAYLLNSPLKATDPEGLLYGGDQPQPGRGRPRYEPNGPTPLTPPLPPPRWANIQLQVHSGDSCCKEDSDAAIKAANQRMNTGKCKQWFLDHDASGSDTYHINFHSSPFKVMCYITPMWTWALSHDIGVCKSACDYGVDGMASLFIHEVAHHYCPVLGGEECAVSAQEACRD